MSTPPSPHAARFKRKPTRLADLVPASIAPVLQARGMASAAILTEWAEIVGPAIAQYCAPLEIKWPQRQTGSEHAATLSAKAEKASRAALIVACPGAFALDLQASSRTILEAINRRLGWNCVASLQIRQMPLPQKSVKPAHPPLDPALLQALDATLRDIKADDLRDALAVFGAEVQRRAQKPTS